MANAIYDGTDAIMLSGETAAGKYPVEALKMMVQIAQTTEPHLNYKIHVKGRNMYRQGRVSSAVGMAAVRTARELQAKAIVNTYYGGKNRTFDLQFPSGSSHLCHHPPMKGSSTGCSCFGACIL